MPPSTILIFDFLIVPTVFLVLSLFHSVLIRIQNISEGRHDRDRMVVGITTTYAISAFHHLCCEFQSRLGRGVQHYVIKFVISLQQVDGFLRVLRCPPPIKLTATI
jgi:hypothetical protein